MSAETGVGDILVALRMRRSRPALTDPAPDPTTLRAMLAAADNAPDHGRLRPWRHVVVEGRARAALGDAFGVAHAERDPAATQADIARSRGKPLRAPMIVAVVATPRVHPRIPVWEQRAAAVCATYGLVIAADAAGFGAMWRTGWFGDAPKVRAHLGLADTPTGEHAESVVGWVYLGTPAGAPPPARRVPEPAVTWLR